ncbi:MAG: hypothetical protein R3F50_05365 [Gammaproteobacteria bacterium]
MILKASTINLLFYALLGFAGAARAELLLVINGIHFGPGDTLDVSIGLDNTGSQIIPVDVYFAVLSPDANTVLFISGDASTPVITLGQIADPSTWMPLAQDVVLKDIGDTGPIPYLSVTLPEELLIGDYQIAFATTRSGTFEVVEAEVVLLRMLENSIKSNLGNFVGSWKNITFDSNGAARFRFREVSPGMLEYTIDLDGFVDGDQDPFPIVREIPLADFTGRIDFETNDPLFLGPVTNVLTPKGDYTYTIANVGIEDLGAFTATGSIGRFWLDLDFQVDSTFGIIVGTVLATRRAE